MACAFESAWTVGWDQRGGSRAQAHHFCAKLVGLHSLRDLNNNSQNNQNQQNQTLMMGMMAAVMARRD